MHPYYVYLYLDMVRYQQEGRVYGALPLVILTPLFRKDHDIGTFVHFREHRLPGNMPIAYDNRSRKCLWLLKLFFQVLVVVLIKE